MPKSQELEWCLAARKILKSRFGESGKKRFENDSKKVEELLKKIQAIAPDSDDVTNCQNEFHRLAVLANSTAEDSRLTPEAKDAVLSGVVAEMRQLKAQLYIANGKADVKFAKAKKGKIEHSQDVIDTQLTTQIDAFEKLYTISKSKLATLQSIQFAA